MLFDFSANNMHSQLSELPQQNEYKFYFNGCVVKPERAAQLLKKQECIVAKKKQKQVSSQEIQHQKEKLQEVLSKEDTELFVSNPSTLFEEFSSFKYLNIPNEEDKELDKELKERLKEEFVYEENFHTEVDEQLEYVNANWKQMMKQICHAKKLN